MAISGALVVFFVFFSFIKKGLDHQGICLTLNFELCHLSFESISILGPAGRRRWEYGRRCKNCSGASRQGERTSLPQNFPVSHGRRSFHWWYEDAICICFLYSEPFIAGSVAQSVGYRLWEQGVAGSILQLGHYSFQGLCGKVAIGLGRY